MSDEQANDAIRRHPDYQAAKRTEPITLRQLRDVLEEIVTNPWPGSIDAPTVEKCARGIYTISALLALTDGPIPPLDPDTTIFPMPEMTG